MAIGQTWGSFPQIGDANAGKTTRDAQDALNANMKLMFGTSQPEQAMLTSSTVVFDKIGLGLTPTSNMGGVSIEDGLLTIKETTTPTADTNYGKVYTKADNKLYFQDGAGVEHEIAFA